MSEFALEVGATLWSEVPEAARAERFVAERTAGLTGEAREAAVAVAEYALGVRAETGRLTLLLQEPESSLHAVAVFSLVEGRDMPDTERSVVELVCGTDVGPWEPTVVEVELGEHRGFRVSELVAPESDSGSEFHAIEFTQTTYVLPIDGQVVTVALSPAAVSVAGLVLAMVEPVLATWETVARV